MIKIALQPEAQPRAQATALFFKADRDYGSRVAKGLGLDINEVERLANTTNKERAEASSLQNF